MRTDPAAATARIRGSVASTAERMGPRNPTAAKISRLPTTWYIGMVCRSCNGTRLTALWSEPARLPGTIVKATHGTVP